MTDTITLQNNPIEYISYILILLGGLNWLVIGLLNKDYVAVYSGAYAKYIYILVGIAALYMLAKKIMEIYQKQ